MGSQELYDWVEQRFDNYFFEGDLDNYEEDAKASIEKQFSDAGAYMSNAQKQRNIYGFNKWLDSGGFDEDLEVGREEARKSVLEALKQEANNAITEEEFREVRQELRKINPKSFGGIRSGETRRGQAGFRVMFG